MGLRPFSLYVYSDLEVNLVKGVCEVLWLVVLCVVELLVALRTLTVLVAVTTVATVAALRTRTTLRTLTATRLWLLIVSGLLYQYTV